VDDSWLLFFFVGLLAQLVDGALGMAFGVTATTVMLSFGTAPAQASAMVHIAELFTTAASGASHWWHRDVDWTIVRRILTGVLILARAMRRFATVEPTWRGMPVIGFSGVLDAIGGGGWVRS
jgi:uncharacterized membrane protein YfcA